MKTLTHFQLEDWALLFDGDELIYQDHMVDVSELSEQANGEPFVLICYGLSQCEALDNKVYQDGSWDFELPLSEAMKYIENDV